MAFVKGIFSISIICSILLNLWASTLIIIHFKYNQAEIAETVCVEKDIPESTCNGQCHLKDQLEEVEEQEEGQPVQSPKQIRNYTSLIAFVSEKWSYQLQNSTISIQLQFPTYGKAVANGFPTSIEYPPNTMS